MQLHLSFHFPFTGEDHLVVMSRDFEVIYEAPLRTEDYGEGKFNSKQAVTFHSILILCAWIRSP